MLAMPIVCLDAKIELIFLRVHTDLLLGNLAVSQESFVLEVFIWNNFATLVFMFL